MKKVSREFNIRGIKDLEQLKKVTNEFNIDYPVSEDVSILAEP